MRIDYTKRFMKMFQKLKPALQDRFITRLELWKDHPAHPMLNDHPLKGKFAGARSINVTGDLRAIYWQIDNHSVEFDLIGTHSQLYG